MKYLMIIMMAAALCCCRKEIRSAEQTAALKNEALALVEALARSAEDTNYATSNGWKTLTSAEAVEYQDLLARLEAARADSRKSGATNAEIEEREAGARAVSREIMSKIYDGRLKPAE